MNQTCKKCGDEKVPSNVVGKKWRCRRCHNETARRYRQRHPDWYRKQVAKDPFKYRRHKLRTLYGLTLEQFNSMLERQQKTCALCGKPEVRKMRKRVAPLVVDHDHATGKVRDLLCHRCNVRLAAVEDPAWLMQALGYLKRHGSPLPKEIADGV